MSQFFVLECFLLDASNVTWSFLCDSLSSHLVTKLFRWFCALKAVLRLGDCENWGDFIRRGGEEEPEGYETWQIWVLKIEF